MHAVYAATIIAYVADPQGLPACQNKKEAAMGGLQTDWSRLPARKSWRAISNARTSTGVHKDRRPNDGTDHTGGPKTARRRLFRSA
jgi:hypothetical protein